MAGVDLGSNSFHMVVARVEEDGRVHVLDRLRDPVRLAAGLNERQELTDEAIERALAALERFGERLRELPDSAVRAVGTNTLRRARNGGDFEERAGAALGHPIEIISGHEEARLIYLGVAHSMPGLTGNHLVLDIGGGSTECVIGTGFEPLVLDSFYMGCVSYTQRFFGNGRLARENFRRAEVAAELELTSIAGRYRRAGWQHVSGGSGTILAVSEVLRANAWTKKFITRRALEKLVQAMIDQKRIEKLSLRGLEGDRIAVFAGGVAILAAVFDQFGIEEMAPSAGALREGLVHELVGRVDAGDLRDRTVETFVARYKVDRAQAERVERTALALLDQASRTWELDAEVARRLLAWAARVHEIGLSINYAGYHKHGAYILGNGEMPGFSIDEQSMLAAIVGGQRRKLSKRQFSAIPGERGRLALQLALLLRVAVRLHHSRSDEALPEIGLRAEDSALVLEFPPGWLEARPLTRADLEEEAGYLEKVGVALHCASPEGAAG